MAHDWVRKCTRSGHCITIASAQGRAIDGEVTICDTAHRKLGARQLCICLSRSRSYEAFSIEGASQKIEGLVSQTKPRP